MFNETALPAALSALHLVMAILRRHQASGRSITSPFVLPSFAFVLAPWLWPAPADLALGVCAHAAWWYSCARIAPGRVRPRAVAPGPARTSAAAAAPPRRPPAFVTTAVLAVLDEATDIRTFRLARPLDYEFSPGQFLAVRVLIDGRPHVRCYSISSAPHTRGYLEISVRRQGLVSATLHATVHAGSTLAINHAGGQFVYPQGDDRPLVLIAGGVGITPLMSMLRHGAATEPARPITLLYSARGEGDLAFQRELQILAERHPLVRVVMTVTRGNPSPRVRTGRIDAKLVHEHIAAPSRAIFCLCGPRPMIDDVRSMLAAMGVPPGQVRYEQFETAVAACQVNTAVPAAAASNAAVRVTFVSSGISVAAPASKTLLEIAEDEGVGITSSCRSGVCQACRTRLRSGDADCRSDVLDAGDRAAGFVLPCVTWPNGDCVLEA